MSGELRVHELITLKTIAEILNQCSDLEPMLNAVLEKLLELTGLQAGWIFLVHEAPDHTCAADCGLPPALAWGDKQPMRGGSCWCLDRYRTGALQRAVNILNCKRLEDAVEYRWGDTAGITHHATVPLWTGDEMFGVLNVAAPGKQRFSGEELALLQSVAYQIGTAVERIKLFQSQRRRAEKFARLGDITRRLGALLEPDKIPSESVEQAGTLLGWPSVALYLKEGRRLSLRAVYGEGRTADEWRQVSVHKFGPVQTAFLEKRSVVSGKVAVVPLLMRQEAIGAIAVASQGNAPLDQTDVEVLEALAEHICLALENARLYEQRRELARMEERNRLARDLHDSVCQMLFSLALTARGAEGLLSGESETAKTAMKEIQELSQQALREMRSLIYQLRPEGLEKGLLTALRMYGKSLGLRVTTRMTGVRKLSRRMEETLWRIGQEALNNVRKHAGTDRAAVSVAFEKQSVMMRISDKGVGFVPGRSGEAAGFGMNTMRERAEAVGGEFSIQSRSGKGTVLTVRIPLETEQGE